MLKYVNSDIVFQEIPDEVTLAINISNCPCHCPGCHSHYLWEDIGLPLNTNAIDAFVEEYGDRITCTRHCPETGHWPQSGTPFGRHTTAPSSISA